ncbi:DUF2461 domain-containing protein [Sediminibacterium roseum]|uniref:DUF2461 domain-containing protein n=1 Tax=Sediminibacterium roseum TaxID=1978412 RepID=A0ABW9ZX74_9BACT|nr:DUF2461 domain-containing protein [Sediminibacterium roseum]NCI51745.1 DUF2461 domain-containing protein [Sediminibacterium roseum]
MLQSSTLTFLKNLKKNNNREWFEKNRAAYEAAKEDMARLVDDVIRQFGKKEEGIAPLTAKECVYRINRDVRFSKNKAPYKNNMAASLIKGGKKAANAGYYIHIQPGGESFIGGGRYMVEPSELKKIRQEIDYSWEEFEKIIGNKKFRSTYGELERGEGMALSREPKGYEKDNPAIEYIKLKSFVATTSLTDADLTGKDLVKKITAAFETLQPLIRFLNRALED